MGGRNQSCKNCKALRAELATCHERIVALEGEAEDLKKQLSEATNLIELQRADIDRYKAEYERVQPNTPERVPRDQLQLAFERVLESMSDVPSARELAAAAADAAASNDNDEEGAKPKKGKAKKKKHLHTRRRLDLTDLPVEEVLIDPDDVVAADGEGFELVGEEVSDRVAFKPASYIRLRFVRRKWARKTEKTSHDEEPQVTKLNPMAIAPLPGSVWPSFMADPSAVSQHVISKYGDCLPLHRQEGISGRTGFRVPRSTQCGWLGEAYRVLYRIVQAFCIATDATGAPVRAPGGCEKWHIFVFIADRDHVVFRYSEEHTSEAMKEMLGGYHGHLLSDAAAVYDILHREGAIESACWFHLRRYFWRGLPTDKERALEVLSLIAKLFEIDRRKDRATSNSVSTRARCH
jgi:transposase